ncbi:S-adenosylmethionine:tRNA ribosyltransferase-isomerase [Embleya scabrispora]|uniref:S-adenosylmethionine:tRNA ribosyltransferase-isomerase n=1 Tax=Embleya scabrispora TaxID=159449 RepID=UPI0003785956|nr:S-adenosylmethionine:tRNA ribosyltransferase-isomerase [Embleya scabrispora]MYS82368.1 S-adenosylmethionine:tRNA ribosyltransferase-isomerase [Streptomyces sp. SID5474]
MSTPVAQAATEPAEARGLTRDGIRLLVHAEGRVEHTVFRDLGRHLGPGDLLVVNTSATLPAAVDGYRADGSPVTAHFATRIDAETWVLELRHTDGTPGPVDDVRRFEAVRFPGTGCGMALLLDPYPAKHTPQRLWKARITVPHARVETFLADRGRPITYAYLRERWPLTAYQTVFARDEGSAEMPSAGRPFTNELVVDLITRGVTVAPIVLHTGVSSQDMGEPPLREWFNVPEHTASLVRQARRVIAVGTTVTRALESAVRPDGEITAARGWTDLLLGPDRPARVVDGIISGLHAPEATHLLLLEAVVGPAVVRRAYDEALAEGYLWHEFGDSSLLLP